MRNYLSAIRGMWGKPAEAPAITGLDVIGAGMLFGSNNTGQGDSPGANMGYPGAWYAIVTTASDTVTPDPDPMTLARMTIDTTGFDAGTFAFSFFGSGDLDGAVTDFGGWELEPGNELQFETGQLNIVPEPSAWILMTCGLAFGTAVIARRRWIV